VQDARELAYALAFGKNPTAQRPHVFMTEGGETPLLISPPYSLHSLEIKRHSNKTEHEHEEYDDT